MKKCCCCPCVEGCLSFVYGFLIFLLIIYEFSPLNGLHLDLTLKVFITLKVQLTLNQIVKYIEIYTANKLENACLFFIHHIGNLEFEANFILSNNCLLKGNETSDEAKSPTPFLNLLLLIFWFIINMHYFYLQFQIKFLLLGGTPKKMDCVFQAPFSMA